MKIGVLAGNNNNLYASAMVQTLFEAGCPVQIVVMQDTRLYAQTIRRLRKISFKKLMRKFADRNRGGKENSNPFLKDYVYRNGFLFDNITDLSRRYNFDILYSDDMNSSSTVTSLTKLNLDILIYCSGGILKGPLIHTPKIGVLNAHMGILPKFRGMNVLEWSIFYGYPIGVTIHFIDEGIDTGNILITKKMTIEKNDTIMSLRQKSVVLNVELIKKAITIINNNNFQLIPNPLLEGKQYFVMHDLMKKIAEKKLQKFQGL